MITLINTPILAIGTLGNMEMLVIAALILVLFGAKKIPVFARSVGRALGEFQHARTEFENEVRRSTEEVTAPPSRES